MEEYDECEMYHCISLFFSFVSHIVLSNTLSFTLISVFLRDKYTDIILTTTEIEIPCHCTH